MSEVIKLVQPEDPSGVKALLDEYASRAATGEFNGVMVIALRPNQSFVISSVRCISDLQMIGALAVAQRDAIDAMAPIKVFDRG